MHEVMGVGKGGGKMCTRDVTSNGLTNQTVEDVEDAVPRHREDKMLLDEPHYSLATNKDWCWACLNLARGSEVMPHQWEEPVAKEIARRLPRHVELFTGLLQGRCRNDICETRFLVR